MKSSNKIYSFFIIIALLFWNPLSFYLFYGDELVYSVKILHIFYWFVFITGVFFIFLNGFNKISQTLNNLILTLSFTGILFALLVVLNSLAGSSIFNSSSEPEIKQGLIFEPFSKARYQTV